MPDAKGAAVHIIPAEITTGLTQALLYLIRYVSINVNKMIDSKKNNSYYIFNYLNMYAREEWDWVKMKKVINILSSVSSSCPYTMLFKKVIRLLQGEPIIDKARLSDRERDLLFRIKLGQGIALVGLFCPIFWISLFSGVRGEALYFNACHSGLVILVGLGFILKYRIDLEKERSNKNAKSVL